MERKIVKVFLNGKENNAIVIAKLKSIFTGTGIELQIYESRLIPAEEYDGFLRVSRTSDVEEEIAKSIKEGITDYVIVGGDGFHNDSVNGLVNSGVDLEEIVVSSLPLGSSNDFAKIGLGIRSTADGLAAVESFYKYTDMAKVKSADILRMQCGNFYRYFISDMGATIDADVVSWANSHPKIKKVLKEGIYVFANIFCTWGYKPRDLQITTEGKTGNQEFISKNSYMAIVLNTTDLGGMYLCPDADISDGRLDMFIARNDRFLKIMWIMAKSVMRNPISGESIVDYAKEFEKVTVRAMDGTDMGRNIQVDGELYMSSQGIKEYSVEHPGKSVNFLSLKG